MWILHNAQNNSIFLSNYYSVFAILITCRVFFFFKHTCVTQSPQCTINAINPTSKQETLYCPLQHVGSTQPVDTDAVPTQHTAEAWRACVMGLHYKMRAKERRSERLACLIRRYKTTHTLKISLKSVWPSQWGNAKLLPHFDCTYTHTLAYEVPHRSDYKSGYANSSLEEKLQPPSQCGNSVNKWSTKPKVLKERITKSLFFSFFSFF